MHIPHNAVNRVTRDAVLRRDRHSCTYCGERADTVDHVLPRCRGGGDTWVNLVAACQPCNGLKGDRTPQEAGMKMIREPFEPKQRDRFRCAPVSKLVPALHFPRSVNRQTNGLLLRDCRFEPCPGRL